MLDDYQDLIDELLETPSLVRTLVANADGAPSPQSLAAISALHERDLLLLERLYQMTHSATPPTFRQLPPLDVALAAAPVPTDTATLVHAFADTRGDLVSLLMNLPLSGWDRLANDEVVGEITLSEEVERHIEFEEAIRSRF